MSGFEFVQRGKVLIVKKQYQDAVKVCRLGLLAHPTLVEGRLVLGTALMALGRYDEVLAEMRVALELDKLSPLGYLLKGEALLRKGDFRQANEVLNRAKELDPLNDKIGGLLDEVRRGRESTRPRAIAAPSFKAEATETRAYPAVEAGLAPPGMGDAMPRREPEPLPSSARAPAGTPPTEMRPTQASGQVLAPVRAPASAPTLGPQAAGDKSTIVLDSRDVADAEDTPDPQSNRSAMELRSKDLEEVSNAVAMGDRSFDARDARTVVPRLDDSGSTTLDDEPSSETLERRKLMPLSSTRTPSPNVVPRRPARADEPSEDFVIVDLATAARPLPVEAMEEAAAQTSGTGSGTLGGDSVERMLEPASRDVDDTARDGLPPRRAALPTLLEVDRGHDDETAALARPAPRFGEEDDMSSTSPKPTEVRPERSRRPSGAPLPAPPEEPLPQPVPLPGIDPWTSASRPPSGAATGAGSPSGAFTASSGAFESAGAFRSADASGAGEAPAPRSTTDSTRRRRDRDRGSRSGSGPAAILRYGLRPLVMGLIAAFVVAGAIAAGLVVREQRVKRRIAQLTAQAGRLAGAQTFRAYAQAEANYRAIMQQRDDVSTRGALAHVRAAMAAEFGETPDEAIALLQGLSGSKSRDISCARVFVAIAQGDGAVALRAAGEAVAQYREDAEAHYLLGRSLLLIDDAAGAATELAESVKRGATPLSLTWLAIAESARGRPEDGIAAVEQALALAPRHPTALVARARLQAATGKLPAGGVEPDTSLTELLRAGAQAAGARPEPPLVSRAQLGWASLALAEVKLARGDVTAARGALAAAAESRPANDRRFVEALFADYLAAGDATAARAEAERAVQAWPTQGAPHVWLAKVALYENKPDVALAELDKAGAAGAHPEALSIRGQAKLALGDLEGAARDLDDTLMQRPDDRVAILARARVDLGRGDARSATTRTEALYLTHPEPDIAVVYGAALRESGDRAKARTILEEAIKSPRGKRGFIELARLDRLEARWAEAREAYARAIEQAPRAYDARLEAALLAWDQGDARGARAAVDALVIDAPVEAEVLLECGRLHTVTGDYDGAGKCLDAAARLNLAPGARGRLARERGRLLLARRDPKGAAAELKRALPTLPEDADARLLLIDANLQLDDKDGVNAVLTEAVKKFSGRAEADLARGRVHVANGAFGQAIEAFIAADKGFTGRGAPPRLVSEARSWLGRAYYFNNELAKARAALEDAARLDPSNVDAHFHLGLLFVDQGQLAPARTAFQHATEANPGFADAWFFFGDTSRQLKDRAKATLGYQTYLKLFPKGDYAAEARKYLGN